MKEEPRSGSHLEEGEGLQPLERAGNYQLQLSRLIKWLMKQVLAT